MINFKTEKIKQDFYSLEKINPGLRAIIFELSYWVWTKFFKPIHITHLTRTQKEQDDFYHKKIEAGFFIIGRDGLKHYSLDKKNLTLSSHQAFPCKAVDLRSFNFTEKQIIEIKNYLEKWFGGFNILFLKHNQGSGEHIHFEIKRAG